MMNRINHSHHTFTLTMKKFTLYSKNDNNEMMKGIAGGEHTLILDERNGGKVYSAGACGLGWCREFDLTPFLFKFRPIPFPEPIRLVHASYYHNLAVTKDKSELYTWGCGTFTDASVGLDGVIPALGPHATSDRGEMPQKVNLTDVDGKPARVKAVTGGAYHSAVLTEKGNVLTFGAGQLGQLGRETSSTDGSGLPVDSNPQVASIPTKSCTVDKIGAGFYNTFALCKTSGDLYCTGENQNQQCGEGPKNLYRFTKVKEVMEHVVDQVEGGYCHTLIKNTVGQVFSMGCGEDGQRGDNLDGESENRATISQVHLPGSIRAKKVAAGANHSIILGDDSNAYAFGLNDVGQCGVQTTDEEDEN